MSSALIEGRVLPVDVPVASVAGVENLQPSSRTHDVDRHRVEFRVDHSRRVRRHVAPRPPVLRGRTQPGERIDVHEDYELRYWTQKFGVTKQQLEAAVREVGTNAEDVAIELGK
mgnify:CR=1 FL=1